MKQTQRTQRTQTNSTTSNIDLTQLTVQELMDLRDRVNTELATVQTHRIKEHDVKIEYNIVAHSINGVFHETSGVMSLPSILHPRLSPTAPGRFESMFYQQIIEPLYTDLSDLIPDSPHDHNSVRSLPMQAIDRPPL